MNQHLVPQLALIMLWMVQLGICLALNGTPRKGNVQLHVPVVRISILAGLLYSGGFFDHLLDQLGH